MSKNKQKDRSLRISGRIIICRYLPPDRNLALHFHEPAPRPLVGWLLEDLLHFSGAFGVKISGAFGGPRQVEADRGLVDQVRIFGAAATPKAFDLHELRQSGLEEVTIECWRGEVMPASSTQTWLFWFSFDSSTLTFQTRSSQPRFVCEIASKIAVIFHIFLGKRVVSGIGGIYHQNSGKITHFLW